MEFTLTAEEQAAFDRQRLDAATILQGKVDEVLNRDAKTRAEEFGAQVLKYESVPEVQTAVAKMAQLDELAGVE